jgi:hypothetical protein
MQHSKLQMMPSRWMPALNVRLRQKKLQKRPKPSPARQQGLLAQPARRLPAQQSPQT